MRWPRFLNIRTGNFVILTVIIGALVIYDYNYISNLKAEKIQGDDRELFEDISINNEITHDFVQHLPSSSDIKTVTLPNTGDRSSYVGALEEILSAEMTPAKHVRSQSPRHINLGFILINLKPNTTELSVEFRGKVTKER